jgi:hypothetical protein
MNDEFDIWNRKSDVFDFDYAKQLQSIHPEIWASSSGTFGDTAFKVLSEIMDQDGVALTPEQVEILDLRDAWIKRHRNDSSPESVIAQIKWLAIGSIGEPAMKRMVSLEVGKLQVKKASLRDPKGGLTAAGRKYFKRTEGANLKPGVKGRADTPEKMRRKGSFLTRFFTNPSGPMKDEKGRPTRLALSASAWGEPVPQNAEDAAALAAKGRRMLERYQNTKKKD